MAKREPRAIQDLSFYMVQWRERRRYTDYPWLPTTGDPKRPINRETAAILSGCSAEHYRHLERGNKDGTDYSAEVLDMVASALRLSVEEREILYQLAVGHPPHPAPHGEFAVDPDQARFIDACTFPVYVEDETWNVVAFNTAMLGWFPWLRVGMNVARWVLTYPEARLVLPDWEHVWAPGMVRQLRTAQARQPHNQRLAELRAEIMAQCPEAATMSHEVLVHGDGDRRQVRIATGEVVTVTMLVWNPARHPEARMTAFLPLDAAAPDPDRGR